MCVYGRFLSIWPWSVLVYITVLVSTNLTLHHNYCKPILYTVIVYIPATCTLSYPHTYIFKCGGVLAFIILTACIMQYVRVNVRRYV